MKKNKTDIIVIGGGHAGIEASLAASRMGCPTAMVTFSLETIGQMSCNPAIGGVGKGQLVKEIDVLGGEMGLAADQNAIQFRQLNASKGQAVRSSRCQCDRKLYRLYMQKVVTRQEDLTVVTDEADEIIVRREHVVGVRLRSGVTLPCRAVVIAAGTYLDGRIHMGKKIVSAGRIDEPASNRLTQNIRELGFEVPFFKTGTPPRIDGRTIDFSQMEVQYSDEKPIPFSFRTQGISRDRELRPCYITRTSPKTLEIIRANMHLSPMYSGQIHATGVRYCPSIEDKVKRFPDKLSHHVFLEPEGLDTDLYYPNGISTGLPEDVQEAVVHSIPGLERARMVRPGYSIEHGIIPSTALTADLQTKKIKGLFLAGQINGTTGYEEAAAQGLMAGINAALMVRRKKPLILARHEAYIGVLIDDLTTKGTDEPYRMFTSRVEYRLLVREDNADKRLAQYAQDIGLMDSSAHERIQEKYRMIDAQVRHLKSTMIRPGSQLDLLLEKYHSPRLKQAMSLSTILKRPEIRYPMIAPFDGHLSDFPESIVDQVEYEIKYEGFIKRQLQDVKRLRHIENIRIPPDLDYAKISGISAEIQQKLKKFVPANLGQALRIYGVTPAAITILMVYLRKMSRRRAHGTGFKAPKGGNAPN